MDNIANFLLTTPLQALLARATGLLSLISTRATKVSEDILL
jgi:hypothetical protein